MVGLCFVEGQLSGLQYIMNCLKEQHRKCWSVGNGISWYLYFACQFLKRRKHAFLSHQMQAALQIDFGPCHEVNAQLDLHWHENTICVTPTCFAGRREDTGLSSWSQLLWEKYFSPDQVWIQPCLAKVSLSIPHAYSREILGSWMEVQFVCWGCYMKSIRKNINCYYLKTIQGNKYNGIITPQDYHEMLKYSHISTNN